MKTWTLENADEIADKNKYTFFKSSRETIASLKPGDLAKLIFLFDSDDKNAPGAERMWVLIDEVNQDGTFIGRLDNQPVWIKDLSPGDQISFDTSHIINTEHDDDDNLVEQYIKRCFVTNRILKDGVKVGYLYREEPDNDRDSGWRFTANDESDEYMDDAANLKFVSIGLVLSHDDSFIHLLDSPAGSSFAWDHRKNVFVQLDE